MAGAIRARHGDTVAALLFYGSCLRDRVDADRVLDFYLFVDRYRDFHRHWGAAALNALVPPNVYYIEAPFEGRVLRAKYAVLSLGALARQTAPGAFQPTLWARLAQPCALAYARDAGAEAAVRKALTSAFLTMIVETVPLLPPRFSPRELWTRAFGCTYATEIRAERKNRPDQLYEASRARFDTLTHAAVAAGLVPGCMPAAGAEAICRRTDPMRARVARARWTARRVVGRGMHVLRLTKAAFTFANGLDYALWKIGQHSGVFAQPTPWQRRHPLMAAPVLAWRLFRRGAFR